MGKKDRIPKPSQTKQLRRIPEAATQLTQPRSTDNERPSFRFTYIDKNRWLLSDWTSSEINDLIEGLKKLKNTLGFKLKVTGQKNVVNQWELVIS